MRESIERLSPYSERFINFLAKELAAFRCEGEHPLLSHSSHRTWTIASLWQVTPAVLTTAPSGPLYFGEQVDPCRHASSPLQASCKIDKSTLLSYFSLVGDPCRILAARLIAVPCWATPVSRLAPTALTAFPSVQVSCKPDSGTPVEQVYPCRPIQSPQISCKTDNCTLLSCFCWAGWSLPL